MKKLVLLVFVVPLIIYAQEGWVRLYGEEGYGTTPFYIRETGDGGYIVAGNKRRRLFLLKLDKNGDSVWIKQYNRGAYTIAQTSDGGYIVGCDPIWLLKTDAEGDSLWANDYELDSFSHVSGHDVKQTKDGKYVVAASGCYNDTGFLKGLLSKVDETGNMLWAEKF